MSKASDILPLSDLLEFYGHLLIYAVRADYVLANHYNKFYELGHEALRSVMSLRMNSLDLIEYMDTTFKMQSIEVKDGSVEAYKISKEIKTKLSKMMIAVILSKEDVVQNNISLVDN